MSAHKRAHTQVRPYNSFSYFYERNLVCGNKFDEVRIMKISIELSQEQARIFQNTAERLGLNPEELARASLAHMLGVLQDDFEKAATYVLNKNQKLYRRLR